MARVGKTFFLWRNFELACKNGNLFKFNGHLNQTAVNYANSELENQNNWSLRSIVDLGSVGSEVEVKAKVEITLIILHFFILDSFAPFDDDVLHQLIQKPLVREGGPRKWLPKSFCLS